MKKIPFDHRLSTVAQAGLNELASSVVQPGLLFCVQRLSVENETSSYTSFRVIKAGGGMEIPVIEQQNPLAATLYWYDEPFYLVPGQRLVFRLAGCTAGDRLVATFSGWWARVGPGLEFDGEVR